MIITYQEEITIDQLWEAVWGCDGAGLTYWANKVRTIDGKDIDFWVKNSDGEFVANPQDFKIHNYYDKRWHNVTLNDLVEGYRLAKSHDQKHCFTFDLDIEDPDACFGDMIIQYAIFGELRFG